MQTGTRYKPMEQKQVTSLFDEIDDWFTEQIDSGRTVDDSVSELEKGERFPIEDVNNWSEAYQAVASQPQR